MPRKKAARRSAKKSNTRVRKILFGYPLIIFLFLCTGVFLLLGTFPSLAQDLHITAKVHAPFVTSPATISSPVSGDYFTSAPVTVSGNCPENAVYVEIVRNQIMSGVAICNDNRNFQLLIDLLPGQNELTAHVFNLTDDEGPVSATVTVFYNPPANGPAQSGKVSPMILQTSFVYKGYYVGQELSWPISISGGLAPYTLDIDWGDSLHDRFTKASDGDFNIKHTYTSSGNYKNEFVITLTAADSDNQISHLQFFVIVNPVNNALPGNIYNKQPPSLSGKGWLVYAWPAYASVLLLTSIFWLGEREELIILQKRHLLNRRFYGR